MTDLHGLGIITLDTSLRIRSWSDWLAACSNVPESVALGRLLTDFAPPLRASTIDAELTEVLNTGTTRVLASAFHRYLVLCPAPWPNPHFAEMQQRVTIAPLRDATRIVGVMVTVEDVTATLIDEREFARRGADADAPDAMVARAGADDWRVRAAAARTLTRAATEGEIARLLAALERDHDDFSVLSGAIQILAASQRDVTGPLVGLLSSASANVRVHAALALGALGDAAAAAPLLRALDDEDINVRFHAIEALGRLAAPEGVAALQRIALSSDFFLAFPAIDALARIDDPGVVPALMALLAREDLRPAVVDALGALGDEDCVAALVRLLDDPGTDTGAVARALARIALRYEETFAAGDSIADATRTALSTDGLTNLISTARRGTAVDGAIYTVLGWTGAPASETLASALADALVRTEVTEAILAVGAPVLPFLQAQLADGLPGARVSAALLIGAIGDPRGAEALITALDSHDSELVITAARSVAALGERRAIDALLALFAHPHIGVRQAAIAAVNSFDAETSRSRLSRLLESTNPLVRECALRSIGYFSAEGCADRILAALADEVEDVRRAALEQLPLVDDPQSVPALLDALARETPRNRAAAAHALRLCDDARADAALIDALGDDHAWVRYFAAESLAQRGTGAAADTLEAMARADGAPHARIAAIRALARLDAEALMRVIPSAIDDDESDVAAAAIAALSATTGPSAESLIERALGSSSTNVRVAAATALGHMTSLTAIQMLAWAARMPDSLLSATAMNSLHRIASAGCAESPSAARALLHLGSDATRREDVVALLGGLDAATVAPLSAGGVPQPLRAIVVDALARMRNAAATGHVAAALDDPDPVVRRTAVEAFGRLGSPVVAHRIVVMASADPDAGVRRRAGAVCRRYGWAEVPQDTRS